MRGLSHALYGVTLSVCIAGCGGPSPDADQTDTEQAFDMLTTSIGAVEFASACNEKAAPLVERGVGLTQTTEKHANTTARWQRIKRRSNAARNV